MDLSLHKGIVTVGKFINQRQSELFLQLLFTAAHAMGPLQSFLFVAFPLGLNLREESGTSALALAISTPLFLGLSLQLRQLIVMHGTPAANARIFIHLRIATCGIALIISATFLSARALSPKLLLLSVLIVFIRCVDQIADLFSAFNQLEQGPRTAAILTMSRTSASIATFCIVLVLCRDMLTSTAAALLAQISHFLLLDLRRSTRSKHGLSRGDIWLGNWASLADTMDILKMAFVSGACVGVSSLSQHLPRLLTEGSEILGDLGKATAYTYLGSIITIAAGGAITSGSRELAVAMAVKDGKSVRQTISRSLRFVGVTALCVLVVAVTGLIITKGPRMSDALQQNLLLLFVVIGTAVVSSVGSVAGNLLTANRAVTQQLPLNLLIGIISAGYTISQMPFESSSAILVAGFVVAIIATSAYCLVVGVMIRRLGWVLQ